MKKKLTLDNHKHKKTNSAFKTNKEDNKINSIYEDQTQNQQN